MKNAAQRFWKSSVFILLWGGVFLLLSCQQQEKTKVDLLLFNATIYTVDSTFSTAEAMAVKDGKIAAVGTTEELKAAYEGGEEIDAEGKAVIPGLYDAHAHFLGLGEAMQIVDLVGSQSYDEMVSRIEDFQEKEKRDFILGRGWDQSIWPDKELPTKEKLDKAFPDIPVVLTRVDGHAILANQKALDLAEIDVNTKIEGGSFLQEGGKLTGILVDNAMRLLQPILPEGSEEMKEDALLKAQELCFSYGLTSIADAGTSHTNIQRMDRMTKEGKLKIGLYPMLMYTDSHLDDYLQNGLGENEYVPSRSVKFMVDGAIGSRGAALKEPYADDPENTGLLLESPEFIDELVQKMANSEFQLNTHAIGDAANHVVLEKYQEVLNDTDDRRWRIEHAQIVDDEDLEYFGKNILPSVQPTHAITDMRFLSDRLGEERARFGYRNKDLLMQSGLVALGTDAPVEDIDPYRTFYAAVARKNRKGEPADGFQTENALSREETLRGMTIWSAYAQFEENEKGSLEKGKQADFVILDRDIMEVPIDQVLSTKVEATYLKGAEVYKAQ